MNLTEIIQMGATVFRDSSRSGDAGSGLDIEQINSALSGMMGSGGGLNLGSLLENLNTSGLGDVANSWLGDAANQGISPEQVGGAIGSDQISELASKLGLSVEEAAGGLSDALPQMVDKASSGGSLLDSIGGVEGAIDLAGKLFGRR